MVTKVLVHDWLGPLLQAFVGAISTPWWEHSVEQYCAHHDNRKQKDKKESPAPGNTTSFSQTLLPESHYSRPFRRLNIKLQYPTDRLR